MVGGRYFVQPDLRRATTTTPQPFTHDQWSRISIPLITQLMQEVYSNPSISPVSLQEFSEVKKGYKTRQLVCHIRILWRWLAAQDYSVSNASVCAAPTLS